MTELNKRLLDVMSELGLATPKDLSVFCGVTEGLVSQWFSGRTKLGAKPLKALARTNFNLEWIVAGKLPKYRKEFDASATAEQAIADALKMTPGELTRLIASYSQLDAESRELALSFLDGLAPLDASEGPQAASQ